MGQGATWSGGEWPDKGRGHVGGRGRVGGRGETGDHTAWGTPDDRAGTRTQRSDLDIEINLRESGLDFMHPSWTPSFEIRVSRSTREPHAA